MSLGRGAMIAFLLSTVLVAAASGWRPLLGLALLATGLAVLLSLSGVGDTVVGSRLSTTTSAGTAPDQSVRDRYQLWGTALRVWRAHPLTGVGVKNFAAYRDTYAGLGLSSGGDATSDGTYQRVQLLSPHDEYLLILSEQGPLGLACFLALVAATVAAPLRLRRERSPTARFVGLAAAGIAVQFAVTNLYGDIAGPSALLSASYLGLCLAAGRLR
jgi:O-antigen ligase